jgi:hypothetical protein
MPNTTTNFDLPYPASTDDPCDFSEQWCDFTAAIDAVLGTFEAAIARTVPVIPAAMMRLSAPAVVVDSSAIIFDTVIIDTAGWTDMDADPYHITVDRTGRYALGLFVFVNSQAAIPPGFLGGWIQISDPFGAVSTEANMEMVDVGANFYLLSGYTAAVSLVAGTELAAIFTAGSIVNRTIEQASLVAFWHSDTERPS